MSPPPPPPENDLSDKAFEAYYSGAQEGEFYETYGLSLSDLNMALNFARKYKSPFKDLAESLNTILRLPSEKLTEQSLKDWQNTFWNIASKCATELNRKTQATDLDSAFFLITDIARQIEKELNLNEEVGTEAKKAIDDLVKRTVYLPDESDSDVEGASEYQDLGAQRGLSSLEPNSDSTASTVGPEESEEPTPPPSLPRVKAKKEVVFSSTAEVAHLKTENHKAPEAEGTKIRNADYEGYQNVAGMDKSTSNLNETERKPSEKFRK